MLEKEILRIRQEFIEEVESSTSSKQLEDLRIKYLGKKGPISGLMSKLKDVSKEELPKFGKEINILKTELTSQLEDRKQELIAEERKERFNKETIDVTLPGKKGFLGKKHPVQQMLSKAIDILVGMGFSVQYGPDVESDYYNFEALNFAEDHPARDMHDTFYISSKMLLRTHTSNVQVRSMESREPPIRQIAPGRCFRNETISARSHIFFHQIEGFYIDKNVTFSDLLATMDEFWSKLFHEKITTRFRPSYFPFVEPGMEVDVSCTSCKQKGCRICKHTGWLEVAGAGMIHPEVLKSGGIDPEKYSGFAWGLGIERLAMLEYGIKDIRTFTENDLRFLAQFP